MPVGGGRWEKWYKSAANMFIERITSQPERSFV